MRTRIRREWTFEDVRKALDQVYGNVAGVNIAAASGYLVEECPAESQPTSAKAEEPIQCCGVLPEDNIGSPPPAAA